MNVIDMVHLQNDYTMGAVERKIAFQQAASRYALEFERAYGKRLQRRAEDRRQWLDVILPAIKEKAAMAAYERSMASRNHAVVA